MKHWAILTLLNADIGETSLEIIGRLQENLVYNNSDPVNDQPPEDSIGYTPEFLNAMDMKIY